MKKLIKGEKLLKLNTIFKITKFDFLFVALNKIINQKIEKIKKDVIKTKSSTHSNKYNKFK
tara:strand:+ start:2873 stop:3055 length:183 start_codon:yes stop_codon:yes gene_type:complete